MGCTLLTYKQLGNILSRKPFEKSKKTEKFLTQMKKNRTAQFMIQRLGTSKVWTQRKFIPNEHLANFCTICPCKLFFGFLIYQKPLNVHLLAPTSMRPSYHACFSLADLFCLEKENKETPFVILTFLVFTFNINAVLTKNKKDHI